MPPHLERRFVALAHGRLHLVDAGAGQETVVLLHQTPRSWDEYRDVIPRLARRFRVLAPDTPGFGDSDPLPPEAATVEGWAAAVLAALDAVGVERAAFVGHHTGGYVAAEIAASRPDRVTGLVLSSVTVATRAERLAHAQAPAPVDEVEPRADGSHVLELWRLRAAYYPADVDLLQRYLVDCLRAGRLAAEGHRIVARYALEDRLDRVACPTLLLGASADPFAFPGLAALQAALPHAASEVVEGGMIPLPDQLPAAFAAAVERFLEASLPRGVTGGRPAAG